MADLMKQRLIGSLLLLFVLIIITYFLISLTEDKSTVVDNSITLKPSSQIISKSKNIASESVTDMHDFEVLFDKVLSEESDEKIKVSLDNNQTQGNIASSAWFIQLASFSVKGNAKALLKQVKLLGYNAKIEEVFNQDIKLYRLRIGPEYNRKNVDRIVDELTKKLKLNPQVISQ